MRLPKLFFVLSFLAAAPLLLAFIALAPALGPSFERSMSPRFGRFVDGWARLGDF